MRWCYTFSKLHFDSFSNFGGTYILVIDLCKFLGFTLLFPASWPSINNSDSLALMFPYSVKNKLDLQIEKLNLKSVEFTIWKMYPTETKPSRENKPDNLKTGVKLRGELNKEPTQWVKIKIKFKFKLDAKKLNRTKSLPPRNNLKKALLYK